MSISKKQGLIIAAMALAGLLAAAAMLMPSTPPSQTAAHAGDKHAADGHAEDRHANPAAPARRDGDAHAAAGVDTDADTGSNADADTIRLDPARIAAAGVVLAVAGPAVIETVIELPGEIGYNEDRTAHVVPRLAGVVLGVHAELGQAVRRGQLLAVLASGGLSDQRSELLSAERRLALARATFARERRLWEDRIAAEQDYLQAEQAMHEADIAVRNARQKLDALGAGASSSAFAPGQLNRLELRAPFAGVVMEKHLALGEAVREDANVFTISDLSTVWARIAVPPKDLDRVRVGRAVTVKAAAFDAQASGKLTYVGALLGEQTRTATARATLPNPDGAWRPGLFVSVALTAGRAEVPVAVAAGAVRTVDGKPVVFVRTADGFRARPVTTGRGDGKATEIVRGLAAGTAYAADGGFILKAELGKDSAGHAH